MTQRTINRSLIVHNDFALGSGTVLQTRGANTSTEQMIELNFIFRTLDEIRYLDYNRYTRVSLYTSGPLIEYYWDVGSVLSDDGDLVLAPIPSISFGRWIKVITSPLIETTANLTNISHAINTMPEKEAGKRVWDTDLNRPVWAVGNAADDIWVGADGATVHTPV